VKAKKAFFSLKTGGSRRSTRTGIFLHAGARRDFLWIYDQHTERPELKEVITAVSGLTATGKTTTLCRKFSKLPRETSEMIGDDGGIIGF